MSRRDCITRWACAVALGLAGASCHPAAPTTPAVAPPLAPEPDSPAPWTGMGPLEEQVLYFVMIDRFFDGDPSNCGAVDKSAPGTWQGGDLRGLTQKLDYLQDLGITALWITPVVQQIDHPVTGAGFEDWGYHGYWAEDFTRLDPHLGAEEDLANLLAEAHKRKIAVILDVVINHAGYQSRWASTDMVRDPCPDASQSTELTSCLFGLPDFRTEDPVVRQQILDWQLGWFERFAFDGMRFDTFKHVEPEAFASLRQRATKLARDRHGLQSFVTLGEWWGAVPGDDTSLGLADSGAADTLFDFGFHGLAEGFVSGRMRPQAAAHHLKKRHDAAGAAQVHFLDSHDLPTFTTRLDAAHQRRYPLAAVLQMTSRGVPMVTWGNELGRPGGPWPHNRSFMPWEALQQPTGQALHQAWRALIKLRRGAPALRGPAWETMEARGEAGAQEALLVYRRGEALDALAPGQESFVVALRRGQGQEAISWTLPASVEVQEAFSWGQGLWSRPDPGHIEAKLGSDAAIIWRVRGQEGK